jgi:type IV pilus assembly protein PilN
MIKINLLAVERKSAKKTFAFSTAYRMTVGCSMILVVALMVIGYSYWSVAQASARVDAEISTAQQETTRLHSIIQQVQQFEQRKAQLQQRVALIEQLRKEQTGPVHMLDQISRALPPMLWLTDLRQGENANEVLIDGRASTLTNLSDFVANLEGSGYFKRSVEILDSQADATKEGAELVQFSIRAQFQVPGAPAAPAAPAKTASVKRKK